MVTMVTFILISLHGQNQDEVVMTTDKPEEEPIIHEG